MNPRDHIIHAAAASHPDRPSRYDPLFDQIRIGPKVMRNRFYATPHSAGLGHLRPRDALCQPPGGILSV